MNDQHFEFDECIGTGGFGVVYRARMTTSNGLVRVVAVKALRKDVASASAVARLRDEAKLLAALQHRAIIAVHDLVRLDGRIALVSEYVEGADLAELIDEAGEGAAAVPVRVAVHIVGEVASALAAAWASPSPKSGVPMNLVHRDIKPANIRVSTKGVVKLLDFGIAKSETVERHASTGTGLLAGTFGYLAPDRLTEETVRPSADVYALGLVLYEVLTGHRLYRDANRIKVMRMAINAEEHDAFVAEGLTRLDGVPAEVRDLVQEMLRHDASQRPTASEVEARAEDLAETLDGPPMRRWARNRKWPQTGGKRDGLVGQTMTASGLLERRIPSGEGPGQAPPTGAGETWAGAIGPEAPAATTDGSLEAVEAGSGSSRSWWGLALAVLGLVAVGAVSLAMMQPGEPDVARTPTEADDGTKTHLEADDRAKGPPPVSTEDDPERTDPPDGDAQTVEQATTDDGGGGAKAEASTEPPPKAVKQAASTSGGASGSSRAPDAGKDASAESSPEAPAPEPLAVRVSSFPFGAAVSSGGAALCAATPCTVSLPPGKHTLKWALPDGRTTTEVVDVGPGQQEFGHRFAPK